jgi:hypothetical protein
MKRQPAPAKAKLTIFHRLGGFRKITVFQHWNQQCQLSERVSKMPRDNDRRVRVSAGV